MPSHLQLLMLVLGALPSLTDAECNNPGDYIMLDFNTSLVRSNLGGQGGRANGTPSITSRRARAPPTCSRWLMQSTLSCT